jgi:twitching motility protein PilU
LQDLSSNLRAFVSQRLIPTTDGKRCAAIEILLGTPTISDLILRGEMEGIKEIMEKSRELGMQTFDQALFELYLQGKISKEEALKNADSANAVRLKIKLSDEQPASARQADTQDEEEKPDLSLVSLDDEEPLTEVPVSGPARYKLSD